MSAIIGLTIGILAYKLLGAGGLCLFTMCGVVWVIIKHND